MTPEKQIVDHCSRHRLRRTGLYARAEEIRKLDDMFQESLDADTDKKKQEIYERIFQKRNRIAEGMGLPKLPEGQRYGLMANGEFNAPRLFS